MLTREGSWVPCQVFNLFPMCFYDLNFVENQEKDLDDKLASALDAVRAVRGYLLLSIVEGRCVCV